MSGSRIHCSSSWSTRRELGPVDERRQDRVRYLDVCCGVGDPLLELFDLGRELGARMGHTSADVGGEGRVGAVPVDGRLVPVRRREDLTIGQAGADTRDHEPGGRFGPFADLDAFTEELGDTRRQRVRQRLRDVDHNWGNFPTW